MLQGIKTQLYLTVKQKSLINDLLGSYRFVFNKCLEYKINQYTAHNINIGLKELGNFVHQNLRKSQEYHWLKKHNSKVLFQATLDLLDAYKNFFVNDSGFPNFKSKKGEQSCRFPVDAISKKTFNGNRLNLTKTLKNLKFRCSQRDLQILHNAKIKSVTITKEKTGLYFCSFLVDVPIQKIQEPTNHAVGIDFGIKSFAKLCSDTDILEITNPKFTRTNETKLKRLHRNLSKKKKCSKNRAKARIKLARFYYKVNCKKDWFLHNFTTKVVRENQVIGIEDLAVSNMIKNKKLAKSIQELSLGKIKQRLLYKSLKYGRILIKIDRYFPSSKLCSNCGHKKDNLNLSERVFICENCGFEISRDDNAAVNIRNETLRIYNIGKSSPELKSVEQVSDVLSTQFAMKQKNRCGIKVYKS